MTRSMMHGIFWEPDNAEKIAKKQNGSVRGTAQTCHSDMVRRRFPTLHSYQKTSIGVTPPKENQNILFYAVPQKVSFAECVFTV